MKWWSYYFYLFLFTCAVDEEMESDFYEGEETMLNMVELEQVIQHRKDHKINTKSAYIHGQVYASL